MSLALKNPLAVRIASQNNAQKKLIRDTPTMIDCLCILLDRNIISNTKTCEMLESYANGYLRYGQLTAPMLETLKGVILQNSVAILNAMNESEPESMSSVSEREPGEESEDDDPFSDN